MVRDRAAVLDQGGEASVRGQIAGHEAARRGARVRLGDEAGGEEGLDRPEVRRAQDAPAGKRQGKHRIAFFPTSCHTHPGRHKRRHPSLCGEAASARGRWPGRADPKRRSAARYHGAETVRRHFMTVVIAPDSFKGSLDQNGVAEAMAAGLARFRQAAAVVLRPMADGGEGTAAVIQRVRGGAFEPVTVDDAYGRPHEGRILFLPDRTAVIEAAAGPAYVAPNERPAPARNAHSRGLGMLMNAALARGARRVVVALGGTGSSDGGLGALRELGA